MRAHSDDPLSLDQLAQLLWADQGAAGDTDGRRTVPSAGALYPLEVFVAARHVDRLDSGVYLYLPTSHRLKMVREDDARDRLYDDAYLQDA